MIPNFIPAIPEMFVLVMACVILLSGLFLPKYKQLAYTLTQITLVVLAFLTWWVYAHLDAHQAVYTFYHTFVFDRLAFVLMEFMYVSVFMTFLYSRYYNDSHHIAANEFHVLGLLSLLGMMVLVSGHSFITLFLGVELLSLPIYAMVALSRSKERCIEAAIKYFVMGALATGLLLYGMSLLFGATKSLDISHVAAAIAATPLKDNLILLFGMVFVVAGIAFKFGAAPFHLWVPDVYDGAPNSVTLFLSAAPKLAAFGLTIRLLVDTMPSLHVQWSEILIVVGLLSIIIGNLAAIVQTNIKRMLAYSSIAHIGYMMLGLACATTRGYSAAMFYIISYTVMTLGSFGMILLMSRAGFEANQIEDYSGMGQRNPMLAFIMMILMFSMAGIPPLVGFIAKVGIIEALIQVKIVWLAVVAILFAIIGAYYYMRVVRVMYFGDTPITNTEPARCPRDLTFIMALNGIAVLLLGIFPGALFALCHLTF